MQKDQMMTATTHRWTTPIGLEVTRLTEPLDARRAEAELVALEDALDTRRGLVLSGRCDQPGRYRPHDLGHVDPPVEVSADLLGVRLRALNERGHVLLPALAAALTPGGAHWDPAAGVITAGFGGTELGHGPVAEEERTRLPSAFSVLRTLVAALAAPQDDMWGLYGAFGYDLVLGFDPVPLHQERDPHDRTMVLHLPDRILQIDRRTGTAALHSYEFSYAGRGTAGLDRATPPTPGAAPAEPGTRRDHAPGAYAQLVRRAKERFHRGDLFEVVPGQSFHRRAGAPPAEVFRRLRTRNPAPYGLLMNLADGEHLVGASPEMFVRVDPRARTVESCPISGTIARGRDPLEDAEQIRTLLGSAKEESELTMCTDVDRNDKARVCVPGSVEVLARRQIEPYSRLIHTVDHVRGRLRPDRDALDAFLTHMWAVTVTGAPKRAAVAFIEEHERSPRRWYGGAVGRIGFDGALETALTLRTIQIRGGVATVRAGATLLFDSDPQAEEDETVLKAAALLDAVENAGDPGKADGGEHAQDGPGGGAARPVTPGRWAGDAPGTGRPPRVLLVDHQDSFVHMLADYVRQTGAEVVTYRAGFPLELLDAEKPDLLLLAPGPGRPADFGMSGVLDAALLRGIPVFGVCLGLQGIVEYFGGTLGTLPQPLHGKPSPVEVVAGGGTLFRNLPARFSAGRYHSLYADPRTLPAQLRVTARTADGTVMGVEHRTLPIAAIQFHPESIMTMAEGTGHILVANAVAGLGRRAPAAAATVTATATAGSVR
ncbi:anthranilate synthase component I [Streptomyces sp. FXJ1.172]|uniref:anthranilate synthase component I n=1 Tax=Streptomyces sp. FXJ1.172 TaxID=710705 RepID=UPI0007CF5238|nr:anthranilate synthase component I [Streptomyces sp. FXJ1.172]WEO94214.1 anthranilate synthase component I [Streptomyces sp. FXJ1.172]